MSEKHLFSRFFLVFISFICFCGLAFADDTPESECFTYEYGPNNEIIISGLTEHGQAASSLTIPMNVKKIRYYAFYGSSLESLYILGNPVFEINEEDGTSALTVVKETLSFLNLGSNMSLSNMYDLLLHGYGQNSGKLEKIEIEGYHETDPETGNVVNNGPVNWRYLDELDEFGTAIDDPINQTLTTGVNVVLPAEIIRNQVFGLAQVYGRFVIRAELFTFCTEAKYYDIDDGSNWLIYVPTDLYIPDKELYFSRVKFIQPGAGFLAHRAENSSGYVELPRVNENDTYITNMTLDQYRIFSDYEETEKNNIYDNEKNTLVGVTEATEIYATEDTDKGNFTNFILYHGMFYPTSGGTLGANRAYLQILTSDYEEMKNNTTSVNLSIVFEDKDEDAIQDLQISHQQSDHNTWFTIDGRQLSTRPTLPGIYVNGGKKVVVGN